jgi:hypothetical protein
MNDIVDHLLTSLKVVSMIKEGQKVCVRNGHLTLEVQSTGVVTSVRRWINKDSRQTTVHYIKSVVTNAVTMIKNRVAADKLVEGMNEALAGIRSLIVTYADDATVAASLQVMHDRVVTELKHVRSTEPDDEHLLDDRDHVRPRNGSRGQPDQVERQVS